jgi:hypothetical protein
VKTNLGNVVGQLVKKFAVKVGSIPTFLLFAQTNSLSGKWA